MCDVIKLQPVGLLPVQARGGEVVTVLAPDGHICLARVTSLFYFLMMSFRSLPTQPLYRSTSLKRRRRRWRSTWRSWRRYQFLSLSLLLRAPVKLLYISLFIPFANSLYLFNFCLLIFLSFSHSYSYSTTIVFNFLYLQEAEEALIKALIEDTETAEDVAAEEIAIEELKDARLVIGCGESKIYQ